ncbi:ABC transporter substrate-binding protein [Pseudonocardia sp. HH130630-07]|uniref:ABC transporter substrate-binding protein n=1 Tax=Pseudonocardia sp. HH130630-07 TaxID=1690815 RepID=UPI000814BFEA|nr:extracellular solute-binding protein [Pseudonocardia sp. HH130630-07]ANY07714.1 hypothetical protein AFB00_17040 [Pseudonocardia sp. HH130630-07]
MDRRTVLGTLGALVGTAVVAGCGGSAPAPEDGPAPPLGSGGLRWWDQFEPLEDLQRSTFEAFTRADGTSVEYTTYNPNDLAQALQLAYGSNQLPDVFSPGSLGSPVALLRDQGWFSPLGADSEAAVRTRFPAGVLAEGVHAFGGELYTFPLFSPRQYDALLWYDRDTVARAGLDPDDPPASWEQTRAAARAVKDSGGEGLTLPLQFADRLSEFVLELAQTAGFPGCRAGELEGIDLRTGEYRYHDDAFVAAIDYLHSFKRDRLLFAASTGLDARSARVRWAAGGSAYLIDGCYNVGVLTRSFPEVLDRISVAPIPTPDGRPAVLTRPPLGGTFWVSGQSGRPGTAAALLERTLSPEYQRGLATAMDQPPVDTAATAGSDAHPLYKRCVEMFEQQVFVGPVVQARNPRISQVEARMRPVEPNLGAIVQGVLSDQIPDARRALAALSDGLAAERDAAIAEIGGGVGPADWAFPDWRRGEDYPA